MTTISTPDAQADALIDATGSMLKALITLRTTRSLPLEVVAERIGVSVETVKAFEAYDADPALSIIQRYATAVGARIVMTVSDNTEAPGDAPVATVPLKSAQDEVEYRVRTSIARVVAAHRHDEEYPRTFVEDQIRNGKSRLQAHGEHTA